MAKEKRAYAAAHHLKVGIIGGSIAGCTAAVELSRAGYQVMIFERSAGNLEDRGAGIGLARSLVETLTQRELIDHNMPYYPYTTLSQVTRVEAGGAQDHWGRLLREIPAAGVTTSWGALYHQLRRRVPEGVYHAGCEVQALQETETGSVCLQLTDGREWQFDLVGCADGYTSLGRQRLFPKHHLQYAGYVAWRGLIEEHLVPHPQRFEDCVTQAVHEQGHCIVVFVPGRQGERTMGKRQLNWVWYSIVPEEELPTVLTDRAGTVHPSSLPPGAVPAAQTAALHARARELLPGYCADVIAATADPFLQVIYDLHIPSYHRGRICLLGDASSLARPHTAAGGVKAMTQAIALADGLTRYESVEAALQAWDAAENRAGGELVQTARTLGQALVLETPDWPRMDRTTIEQWWTAVMSGQRWYLVDEAKKGQVPSP